MVLREKKIHWELWHWETTGEQSYTGEKIRRLVGKKLCCKELKSLGRQQAEHEPAVNPRRRGPTASWALLAGPREIITSFYSALVRWCLKWCILAHSPPSFFEEINGLTEGSSVQGHQDGKGLTHLPSWGEADRPELFQPRDGFVGETLTAVSGTSRLFVKRWTFTVVQVGGQETMDVSWNKSTSDCM